MNGDSDHASQASLNAGSAALEESKLRYFGGPVLASLGPLAGRTLVDENGRSACRVSRLGSNASLFTCQSRFCGSVERVVSFNRCAS